MAIVLNVSGSEVQVPGEGFVVAADYARDGDDLIMTGADGAAVRVRGYFEVEPPPRLTDEGGASMPGELAVSLAEVGASLSTEGVGAPIGVAVHVEGMATATLPGGIVVRLLPGDSVFQGSLIETDADGEVGILLSDDTSVNLSHSGRLLLDEFVFDPATSEGFSAMTVVQGIFATSTGQIGAANPENVTIRTLVGTIGIRGTTLVVEVDELGQVEITLVDGVIYVTLPSGEEFLLDDSGDFFAIDEEGNISTIEGGDDRLEQLREDTGFQFALQRLASPETQSDPGSQSEQQQSQPVELDDSDTEVETDEESSTQSGEAEETQDYGSQEGTSEEILVVNAMPQFSADEYVFTLVENEDGSSTAVVLGSVQATDADAGDTLTYSIASGNGSGAFAIDQATGELTYLGDGEDFESGPESLSITVRATDTNNEYAETQVSVVIGDANDPPEFEGTSIELQLEENAPGNEAPVSVGSVNAFDADSGDALSYEILGGNNLFEIDADSGAITYVGAGEDYESGVSRHEFTVRATDTSGASAQVAVTVALVDVNDPPFFETLKYFPGFEENASGDVQGAYLRGIEAIDPDAGDTLSYEIVGGHDLFEIDASSAVITYLGAGEDYESGASWYEFTVRATDTSGASADVPVRASVIDVNEPPEFEETSIELLLEENAAGDMTPVGLGMVNAFDVDAGDHLSYEISGGSNLFAIDAGTGAVAYIGAGEDYEAGASRYEITVRATDSGGASAEKQVSVVIVDVNDAPEFEGTSIELRLEENASPVELGTVNAFDADAGDALSYEIVGASDVFEIDASSGAVTYVGAGEDYESGASPSVFTVRATDTEGASAETQVTVVVADVNDPPMFEQTSIALQLEENWPSIEAPVALGSVNAFDVDAGDTLSYEIIGGSGLFQIDASSGAVGYIGAGEDYESGVIRHEFTVRATDSAGATAEVSVTVNVLNLSDNAPVFGQTSYAFDLEEETSSDSGLVLGSVSATDADGDDPISYSIVELEDSGPFKIDAASGVISYVGTGEDYESGPDQYRFDVRATDAAGAYSGVLVTINVVDLSEYAPQFDQSSYAFDLEENTSSGDGVALGTVTATDIDGDLPLSYSIVVGNAAGLFGIDASSGGLFYLGPGEDYESGTTEHELTVRATDTSGASSDATVTVNVLNLSEIRPEFGQSSYAFNLDENASEAGGVALGSVSATDADGDLPISYAIVAGNGAGLFEIDASSGGLVYVGSGEDFESLPNSYELTVRGTDTSGASSDATVTVNVLNLSDNAPEFGQSSYAFNLDENASEAGGVALGSVSATDADGDLPISYSMLEVDGSAPFEVDASSGVISYVGSGEDYENGPNQYYLNVRATDSSGASGDVEVIIDVLNLNDNLPEFEQSSYTFSLDEYTSEVGGITIGTVSATDADGDVPISYAITGGNAAGLFEVDASSGTLNYVGAGEDYDTDPTRHELTVRATDSRGAFTEITVVVNLLDSGGVQPEVAPPEYGLEAVVPASWSESAFGSVPIDAGIQAPMSTEFAASSWQDAVSSHEFASRLLKELFGESDDAQGESSASSGREATAQGHRAAREDADPIGEGYTILGGADAMVPGAVDVGV